MVARIYQPSKTAMQSGRAKTRTWVLEYEPEAPKQYEPLMGWTSSSDMKSQIKLRFESSDAAAAYCEQRDIPYHIVKTKERSVKRVSYSDNFRHDRRVPWSH